MENRLLFDICPEGEFFGRSREIGLIVKRACGDKPAPGLIIVGRRWIGKTEILRRVHRELFRTQSGVVPVYFRFRGHGDAASFAEDFVKELISQYIAFRKRDIQSTKAEPLNPTNSIERIEALLMDDDFPGLTEIISRHREARRSGDMAALLRNAAAAPGMIAENPGMPLYLILDDLDKILWTEPSGMMKEFMESLGSARFSFLASSSSKKILEWARLNPEVMTLAGIEEEPALSMIVELCRQNNVGFDSEIASYAVRKLEGNPMFIKNMVLAARRPGTGLLNLKDFVSLYVSEVTEGSTGAALRSLIQLKGLMELRVLNACATAAPAAPDRRVTSEEELAEKFRLGRDEIRNIIEALSLTGLVETDLGAIKWSGGTVVRDFVSYSYETYVKGRSYEEVRTCMVRDGVVEGFAIKGERVRGRLKAEAMEILKSFNGQKILRPLVHNHAFSSRFSKDELEAGDGKEDEIVLPQIMGCFDTMRWEAGETGPSIVIAHGFQNNRYDTGNEVIWMVGIKDTLTPVNLGDVDNFIRRSRILKENFRTTKAIRWIIGREGFTGEAQKKTDAEGIFSTDSIQLATLKESILEKGKAEGAGRLIPSKEFEIILPMSTKAELVAVRAAEEIGTEMGFDENAIGQIKTALVEACINAFEHSRVKASRVFLRFIAGTDRLTIHVQNGGAEFERPAGTAVPDADIDMPHKRGWGIELMKGMMDEVRFEKLKDGAKIIMVKYLIKKGDSGDDDGKEA